jgi:hypothetical protein
MPFPSINDEILADTNRISIPGTIHSDTSAIVDTDIISEIARLNFLIIRIKLTLQGYDILELYLKMLQNKLSKIFFFSTNFAGLCRSLVVC